MVVPERERGGRALHAAYDAANVGWPQRCALSEMVPERQCGGGGDGGTSNSGSGSTLGTGATGGHGGGGGCAQLTLNPNPMTTSS